VAVDWWRRDMDGVWDLGDEERQGIGEDGACNVIGDWPTETTREERPILPSWVEIFCTG
jgi:hypothetical protein